MIEHKIKLPKPINDFNQILNILMAKFKEWEFKDMGGLSKYKDSIHYHVTSKNKEKGVLEITYLPKFTDELILKIADNRQTEWSKNALNKLIGYLIENKL